MRKLFRTSIIKLSMSIFSILILSIFMQTQTIFAHDGEDHEDNSYSYTAVAGDSLTGFARTAITKQSALSEVSLSPAQRVYAETAIVSKLGNKFLEIGQKVTIPRDILSSAIESAQKLDDRQQAAWQPYAVLVDYASVDKSNEATNEQESDSANSNNKDTAKDDEDQGKDKDQSSETNSSRDEGSSPWYANVFTWILIIAAAIIGWSLWASRKSEDI